MSSPNVRSPGVASRHDEARLAGGGRASGDDLARQQDHSPDSARTGQDQHLIAAHRAFRSARNMALIGRDHLAAVGLDVDFDLVGILDDIVDDLRCIVSGQGSIDDLRAAAGRDWHDLAAALAVPETCPRWRDMTLGTRRLWLVTLLEWTGLSRWEANFCAATAAHWLPRPLSDKQVATLDKLIERAWADGVRL
jgi:hypothetical protein